MHVLENAIYEDIFDTFCSYGYDDENSDPKVLVDTLTEVFIKNTIGFIQSMGEELFTMNVEGFDSLRAYFNRVIYLR